MKRYTVICREGEALTERIYYADTQKDLKELPGFVCVTGSGRVKHPTPEVMQRALLKAHLEGYAPNLVEFYTTCDQIALELAAEKEAKQSESEANHEQVVMDGTEGYMV